MVDVQLSPRQLQIISLLIEGKTQRQIAVQLGLSLRSVQTYKSNLYLKLNVNNAKELIEWAKVNLVDQL